jgi:hypothetical protein
MPLEMIPDKVRQFVTKYIPTINVLEILLLLRQQPDKQWTPSDVSKASLMDVSSAETRLEHLRAAKLLAAGNVQGNRVYRYAPLTSESGDTVSEVAKWYSSHRVSMISLVFASTSGLVRPYGPAIKESADDDE